MNRTGIKVRQITLGDEIPKICIPLMAADKHEFDEQLNQLLCVPCDLIEWRADAYRELQKEHWVAETLAELRNRVGEIPILFTFRTKEEGGERSVGAEEYRRMNLEAAASGCADLIDLEWNRGSTFIAELAEQVHEAGAKVLTSFHDFEKTPEKKVLLEILKGMEQIGADLIKAAVMPQTERDILELLDLTVTLKEQASCPYVTMSMGRMGSVTRLCGALTGSAFTFATAGKASAPGQMEAEFVKTALETL